MKNLSLVKDEDINNFYKIVSNNVKKIRTAKNKPQLDLVLEMGLKSTAFYRDFRPMFPLVSQISFHLFH